MSCDICERAAYASEYFQKKHRLDDDIAEAEAAIERLSKAIEEAEKVEPAAYVKSLESLVQDADAAFNGQNIEWGKRHLAHIAKFAGITKPPQRKWVGLTDDEIVEIYAKHRDMDDYARLIEAKLKEKNT
jgi:hypothetical protein